MTNGQRQLRKEITNFMSRGAWKPVSKKEVVEEMERKLFSTKWIFKKKTEQDNSIRHKARVVSRGFMQIPGVDYTESLHQ
jgi:Reverse transcriptase (RNA-dependent DNA polymerase)